MDTNSSHSSKRQGVTPWFVYLIYLGGLLLLGLLAFALSIDFSDLTLDAAQASRLIAGLCVLLVHLPALLPVSRLRAIQKAGPLPWLRVELLLPILICSAWVLIGGVIGQIGVVVVVGVVITAAVGIGYGAVWGIGLWSRQQILRAAPHPDPKILPLAQTVMRYIYWLRVFMVALSGTAASQALFPEAGISPWLTSTIAVGGVAALTLAWAGAMAMRQQARGALRCAGGALTAQGAAGLHTEVLLYCSGGPTEKHRQIACMTQALRSEGLACAIVARETATVPMLKDFGANHVWPVPYIAGLDALARPQLRAVFYSHDGVKNGHFTRFSQFAHILDATTGVLAKAETLSPALSMYDHIIAPSPEVAHRWRAALPMLDAQRVITLDLTPLTSLPRAATVSATSNVALCLPAPRRAQAPVAPEVMLGVAALVNQFKRAGAMRLASTEPNSMYGQLSAPDFTDVARFCLSVPDGGAVPLSPWHDALLALGEADNIPLIEARRESPAMTWNRADIVIATTRDQVIALRATGKPLLWLGAGPAPEGVTPFDPEATTPLHEMAQRMDSDPLHFTSYHDLLEHADTVRLASQFHGEAT